MADLFLYPLVSGGIDSFVALCLSIEKYEDAKKVKPLFFNRSSGGKGHTALENERNANTLILAELAKEYDHLEFEDVVEFSIPFEWYVEAKRKGHEVYPWGRNLVFISAAASKVAVDFEVSDTLHKDEGVIVTGFHTEDGRDADKDFVSACNDTLRCGLEQLTSLNIPLIRVEAPLIEKGFSKKTAINWIIEKGLMYVLKHSWSCYKDGEKPCTDCDGCLERMKAFEGFDMDDPY